MNILLVGLGPHANRIYLRFLRKHNIKPVLIVDLVSRKDVVEKYLQSYGMTDVSCMFVADHEKDNKELSIRVASQLLRYVKELNVTHAIISTEPKAHFAYANFLINNNISILMDKPITAPVDVINSSSQAEKIRTEYDELCSKYKIQKSYNNNLIFSIQCQRRFHKGYIFVKKILRDIVGQYNIPINYIDIFHSDGMWNMPDEFIYRENHPYKYGYGKLFHSGYHFIDLLTWLLDANSSLKNKEINKCSVYSESYRPVDFMYNFDNKDYQNILHTNKFSDILLQKQEFRHYGELDIYSVINFYHDDKIVTACTLNLMQSGVSRRSWVELPEDTYKSNGRIRHERLNVCVGPLFNIQIHSYQAYEAKDRAIHGGHGVGDIEHFDIYMFRNTDLIGGKPFEKITIADIYRRQDDGFIGYNEKAREKCFIDFINNKPNDSDLLLHKQSILITEMIYKSILHEGRKMSFDYDVKSTSALPEIATITDADFGIEPKDNSEPPHVRLGARGIVLDDSGKVALIHKTLKNEYKLPGGGVDKGEDPQLAFVRECREELGCVVEIIDELGTVAEYKSQENFKQLSFVYVAKKVDELSSSNLTDKEKDEGAECLWQSKLKALESMKSSLNKLRESQYDSVYRSRFMVLRDIRILEYYINNK